MKTGLYFFPNVASAASIFVVGKKQEAGYSALGASAVARCSLSAGLLISEVILLRADCCSPSFLSSRSPLLGCEPSFGCKACVRWSCAPVAAAVAPACPRLLRTVASVCKEPSSSFFALRSMYFPVALQCTETPLFWWPTKRKSRRTLEQAQWNKTAKRKHPFVWAPGETTSIERSNQTAG